MSRAAAQLLVCTGNAHKLMEIRQVLGGALTVVGPADLGLTLTAEETGTTFEANALIKAREGFARSGLVTLADDSGICVDGLGGRPGVRSARLAADHGGVSPRDNRDTLLRLMDGMTGAARQARFVCTLALINAHGDEALFTEHWAGRVGLECRGQGGFGYDPLFYVADGRSVAELSEQEKADASHRGRALRRALPAIRQALGAP